MLRRLFLTLALCAIPALAQQPNPHVAIHTDLGPIELELDAAHAPITVANFLKYVRSAAYNGGSFHRAVTINPDNQPASAIKIEVIQASTAAKNDLPPIPLERTSVTGIHHLNGTISMARGASPDSATSDFFICINDQPSLDFGGKRNPDGQGFAAFGHVVSGMEIVRKIQNSTSSGQKLTPPTTIQKAIEIPTATH